MIMQPVPMIVRRELVPEPDELGNCSLYLSDTSRILSFDMWNDRMCLWYQVLVQPKDKIDRQIVRKLKIVNTGVEFDNSDNFIYKGMVRSSNGVIWHCFVDPSPAQLYD